MSERKSEFKQKFKSPGICYYKPKYDLVEVKYFNIIPFEVKSHKNDPKFKIQKLWRSYNVSTDYKYVDLKVKT